MPGLLLCLALSFLFSLYAPVSTYLSNTDEFAYDIYDLLGMMVPVFAGLFLISSLIFFAAFKISGKAFSVLLALGLTVLAGSYIQGTFLSGNLPPLTGDEIDWSLYDYQRIFSAILWVTVAILAVFAVRKGLIGKVSSYVSFFLTLMLLLSVVLSALGGSGLRDKNDYITTYDGITELSKDNNNLVVLVLDAVDADKYEELKKTHSEYSELFEDFTYYSDTMGAYPYTSRSIPFIITGKWYENRESYYSYCNGAYSGFPLLSVLKSGGYKVNIYEPELQLSEENMLLFNNTASSEGAGFMYPLGFYKVQFQLTGYRYFPYDLKKMCVLTPAKIYNSTQRSIQGAERFDGSNETVYRRILSSGFSEAGSPVFSFIHVNGAHSPYLYDKDLNYSADSDYTSSCEACFTLAGAFLSALKDSGVYDNTAVVILSDHGMNENVSLDSDDPSGRQNPILFVKGIGERHSYTESAAPVSFDDLQSGYLSLLDGAQNSSVFGINEGETRERRYLKYSLYDYTLHEYIQHGKASDETSMEETGVIFHE